MQISITELKKNFEKIADDVAKNKTTVIITKWGKPVAKLEPYTKDNAILDSLKGSVIKYEAPLEPVFPFDVWEANQN